MVYLMIKKLPKKTYIMFKKGDKVVCVYPSEELIKGDVYTIDRFIYNGKGVILLEEKPSSGELGFYTWRFRLVNNNWVDELLRNIVEDVEDVISYIPSNKIKV